MPTRSTIDYLAFRVIRFSTAAIIITPLLMAYFVTLFAMDNASEYSLLGKGVAALAWGCTFLYPRKLADRQNTERRKLAAFGLFIVALFSALIWFPLAAAITRP